MFLASSLEQNAGMIPKLKFAFALFSGNPSDYRGRSLKLLLMANRTSSLPRQIIWLNDPSDGIWT
jgi:hypothetical protein